MVSSHTPCVDLQLFKGIDIVLSERTLKVEDKSFLPVKNQKLWKKLDELVKFHQLKTLY